MMKLRFIAVVAIVLVSAFASAASARPVAPATADKLDPALQSLLAGLAPGEMTTVIVTLRDRADLGAIAGSTRAGRLKSVIVALQAKANGTQGGLRALLRLRTAQGKVARTTNFWVSNAISVTATADVIRELTVFPRVESVASDVVPVVPTAGAPEANLSAVDRPGRVGSRSHRAGRGGRHPGQWRRPRPPGPGGTVAGRHQQLVRPLRRNTPTHPSI